MLNQRPPRRSPAPPVPASPAWWHGGRTALLVFTRQVLLRPARIGTLVLLGGMIAVALVGAEGWWIVLGITLFQVAACALIVMWVDSPRTALRRRAGYLPPDSWVALAEVPRQRRPRPDE